MPIQTFDFVDAERDDIRLLLGLFGPTGGGKTMSALRIAGGLRQYQVDKAGEAGPILLIDTENGRSSIYAPRKGQAPDGIRTFAFKRYDLTPPFVPTRYKELIEAAAILGPSVLIIDQMTSEWTGRGGVLEYHDDETARLSGNSAAAWNKPKRGHTQLMAVLETLSMPVILNFRAKERIAIVGKDVVDVGWRAISEKELPYQLLFSFLVGAEEPGRLSFNRAKSDHVKFYEDAEGLIEEGALATEEVGRRLAAWAAGEEVAAILAASAQED